MACVTGHLRKLRARADTPVAYELPVGEERVALNALLGARLQLEFNGHIRCVACGRATRKSFSQGHCYPCFTRLARCDRCVMSPELCHFHAGTCREPEWGLAHCMQPHVVYVANTSGLKVGITRASQLPTRWIDQGAVQAAPVLSVASRRHAGLLEAAFRGLVSDRTNWRRMLSGEPEPVDLCARGEALLGQCRKALETTTDEHETAPRLALDAGVSTFSYPVLQYPQRVTALNPEKTPSISGRLLGVKGQYLMLDAGVLNVRKFSGYEARVEY